MWPSIGPSLAVVEVDASPLPEIITPQCTRSLINVKNRKTCKSLNWKILGGMDVLFTTDWLEREKKNPFRFQRLAQLNAMSAWQENAAPPELCF